MKLERAIIVILIFGSIEYYSWTGLKSLLVDSSKNSKMVFNAIYLSISIISILAFWFGLVYGKTLFENKVFKGVFLVSFILIVGKLILILFLLMDDIIRFFQYIFQKIGSKPTSGEGISRHRFLTLAGVVAGSLPVAALTYGIVKGAHDYKITKVPLKLKNLPPSFEGKTLVQISDIHAGSFWDKAAVQKGVNSLIDLNPDMVFFTGDIVNNKASELEEYKEIFGQIKAPLGVYSVLGNHDYGDYHRWDPEETKNNALKAENLKTLIQMQSDMGWELLLNESKEVEINGEKIVVVGVENFGTGGFVQHGRMQDAMKGVDADKNILLLSHDPSHWKYEILENYKMVDAMFSGHTHGAQFGIETAGFKWSPIKYRYKEWAGLYKEGAQQLYVNRGFGYLGYPGRFGIRPEITLFTLQKA